MCHVARPGVLQHCIVAIGLAVTDEHQVGNAGNGTVAETKQVMGTGIRGPRIQRPDAYPHQGVLQQEITRAILTSSKHALIERGQPL